MTTDSTTLDLSGRDLPDAFFWDMDGTLLDTEPLWDQGMYALADHLGVHMSTELRLATMGNSMEDSLTKIFDAGRIPESGRDYEGYGEWTLDFMGGIFAADLPWRPGAREALDLAGSTGIPMVLVTNTVRRLADVALRTVGAERFVASVCGDEVAAGKPAPDPYRRATELVDRPARRCLVVEDSPVGAAAASAAGCPALIVPSLVEIPVARGRRFRDSLVGLELADLSLTGLVDPA